MPRTCTLSARSASSSWPKMPVPVSGSPPRAPLRVPRRVAHKRRPRGEVWGPRGAGWGQAAPARSTWALPLYVAVPQTRLLLHVRGPPAAEQISVHVRQAEAGLARQRQPGLALLAELRLRLRLVHDLLCGAEGAERTTPRWDAAAAALVAWPCGGRAWGWPVSSPPPGRRCRCWRSLSVQAVQGLRACTVGVCAAREAGRCVRGECRALCVWGRIANSRVPAATSWLGQSSQAG